MNCSQENVMNSKYSVKHFVGEVELKYLNNLTINLKNYPVRSLYNGKNYPLHSSLELP
jgi:hypothetical protein